MILDTILKWAIPTILTGLLAYITKELKENKKSNHATKTSMVLLLRSQIVTKCEKYIQEGYLPDYIRSCLEALFEQYTALGGNSGVEALVKQAFELPPIKLEEK